MPLPESDTREIVNVPNKVWYPEIQLANCFKFLHWLQKVWRSHVLPAHNPAPTVESVSIVWSNKFSRI
jgi:hypothetical protein